MVLLLARTLRYLCTLVSTLAIRMQAGKLQPLRFDKHRSGAWDEPWRDVRRESTSDPGADICTRRRHVQLGKEALEHLALSNPPHKPPSLLFCRR